MNWVNGPLLAHVGRRAGFDVRTRRSRQRTGGNIMTMTAQPRRLTWPVMGRVPLPGLRLTSHPAR